MIISINIFVILSNLKKKEKTFFNEKQVLFVTFLLWYQHIYFIYSDFFLLFSYISDTELIVLSKS